MRCSHTCVIVEVPTSNMCDICFRLNPWANIYNTIATIFLTSNCGLKRLRHSNFKNSVNSSTKTLKASKSSDNTWDFFGLSSQVLYVIQWPPPFPNKFFVLVLLKTINYNVSFFSSTKSTKFIEPQTLKVTNFEIINLQLHDVQNKELPNVTERSIQIKITLPTHIWSMITIQLSNFNKP